MEVGIGDTVWFNCGELKQNWGKVVRLNPTDEGVHFIKDGESGKIYEVSEKDITGYAEPALHGGSQPKPVH